MKATNEKSNRFGYFFAKEDGDGSETETGGSQYRTQTVRRASKGARLQPTAAQKAMLAAIAAGETDLETLRRIGGL